jgi:polar amino acid transport system substrate-binding protein
MSARAKNRQPVMSARAKNRQPVMSARAKNRQPVMSARAKNRQPVMSARAKNRQPLMKKLAVLLTTAVVLSGCAQGAAAMPTPGVTLTPPIPAGMDELPPQQARAPADEADCNRTASLRPFNNRAAADAAVATIRNRGRLIVGLDIGSNLFSFRDPITGEITGFDVDIAGEIARDIFGTPSQVEYRILSSADRIAALQNHVHHV